MNRREFLQIGGAAAIGAQVAPLWAAVPASTATATILFEDRTVDVPVAVDAKSGALWVRKRDLPDINGFTIKPQGACRADMCIPLRADLSRGTQFNLTGFAQRIGQAIVSDADARVWSLGEIPTFQSGLLASRVAPDFAVPDRTGRIVRLRDFRGRKVLVFTWASWCGCREDLAGWQKVYDELKAHNLAIIAAAEDSAGEAAAGRWYDLAKPGYVTLIDASHSVSSAFQFMNVPSGAWIDEQGRVVRPGEPAWTSDRVYSYGAKKIVTQGTAYVAALRDWVTNGAKSRFAMADQEFTGRVKRRSPAQMEADAAFKLAVWFQQKGNAPRAAAYFEKAQQLNPDDWNYARQAWSFTPDVAGKKWMEKFQGWNGEYYDLKMTPK